MLSDELGVRSYGPSGPTIRFMLLWQPNLLLYGKSRRISIHRVSAWFAVLTSEKHLYLTRPASTVSLQCHEID